MDVLAVRPVDAEPTVVVCTLEVYARTHCLLGLQLYLRLWLRLSLLLKELRRHLACCDLVHEELLWIMDVISGHEVRSLVKNGRLYIYLHHRHLLVSPLAGLLLHADCDMRHAGEPREAEGRHHWDPLVAEAQHLELTRHLRHPVEMLRRLHGELRLRGRHLGWNLLRDLLDRRHLDGRLCCRLECITFHVHYIFL